MIKIFLQLVLDYTKIRLKLNYVRINRKEKRVFGGVYILHNNEEALGTCFDFNMTTSILNIIDKKYILKKEKEEKELYESLKLKYGKKK